jgi:triacylglycerol lipase
MNQKIQRFLLIVQAISSLLLAWLVKNNVPTLNWLSCIGIGICLSFLFQFGLIALDFILSRINQGSRQTIATPTLAPQSFLDMTMAWIRETVDCIRVFSLMQVFDEAKPLAQPTHENPNSGRIPVLMLHGFFCNRALWHVFARRLARRGHPCSAITMEPAFGSIDAYAEPIARAIADLKHKTGSAKVALVGHSMGGIAIRAYLRSYGQQEVAKIITLGTPHVGTWLGRFAHSSNGQQMNLNSLWLKRLAEHETTHPIGAITTVILTELDTIVFPQLQQTLPGAENIAVTGMAHMSMVFDEGVFNLVSERLNGV